MRLGPIGYTNGTDELEKKIPCDGIDETKELSGKSLDEIRSKVLGSIH